MRTLKRGPTSMDVEGAAVHSFGKILSDIQTVGSIIILIAVVVFVCVAAVLYVRYGPFPDTRPKCSYCGGTGKVDIPRPPVFYSGSMFDASINAKAEREWRSNRTRRCLHCR
jgi:hypothetical protein